MLGWKGLTKLLKLEPKNVAGSYSWKFMQHSMHNFSLEEMMENWQNRSQVNILN